MKRIVSLVSILAASFTLASGAYAQTPTGATTTVKPEFPRCSDVPPPDGGKPNYTFASTEDIGPNCSGTDTLSYVAPCSDATEENTTCSIMGSSFPENYSWVNNVDYKTYGYTGPDGVRYVIQRSNDKHLVYRVDGDSIKIMEDTTWANTLRCEDLTYQSHFALQRQYSSNGSPGNYFVKRNMNCNDPVAYSGSNEAHAWSSSQIPLDPSAPKCTSRFAGILTGGNKLIYNGPANCGGKPVNVIAIQNLPGAGEKEVFFFCQNIGLCAWYQGIDFTPEANKPRNWTDMTDVCAGFDNTDPCAVDATAHSQPQFVGQATFSPGVQEFIAKIVGDLFSENNLLAVPDMSRYTNVNTQYYQYLFPLATQQFVNWAKNLSISANTSVCLPTSENKVTQVFPDRGILRAIVPGFNIALNTTELMYAQLSRGQLAPSALNFARRYRDQVVDNTNPADCNQNTPGDVVQTLDSGDNNKVEYANGLQSPLFTALGQLGPAWNALMELFQRGECPEGGCQRTANIPGHVQVGSHVAYAQELADFAGNSNGAFTSLKPVVFKLTKNIGTEADQAYTATINLLGTPRGALNMDQGIAQIFQSQEFALCAVTPLDKQSELGFDCSQFTPIMTPSAKTACTNEYFDKLKGGIDYTVKFSKDGITPNAGYTIPYRDNSFSLNEAMKQEAIALMAKNMMNGGQVGIDNINKYWEDVNTISKANGWNPVFVATLWIEESAAGGHGNATHDLGCLYGWSEGNFSGAVSMPRVSESNVCDQMACLFSHPVKDPGDFSGFLCSYNSDAVSRAKYACDAEKGWAFPKTVKIIYDRLIGAGGSQAL